MKFYLKTFGCQANTSDSERIAGDYLARGYQPTKSWKQADEIVVNSCAVRERAEQRVRGFIHNLKLYYENHPDLSKPKIILTGCMIHHGAEKLRQMISFLDEVLPISEVGFNHPPLRQSQTHAWIPISTGCNSFCTYCIVPFSRGRESSRPMVDILNEASALVDRGYTEITLLGMNVNSYGLEKMGISLRKLLMSTDKKMTQNDLPSVQSQYQSPSGLPPFVSLLKKLSALEGLQTIRFLSSNPWDFYDELIEEIAQNPKIDRYIHLPIQSGSDRILKLMNRGYTQRDYVRLVTKLRQKAPGVVIGTDIIVGFPGETEADFQETVKLAQEINWKVGFVAQYSPRPGTAASRLFVDDIPAAEKKRRWEILDQIINKANLVERPLVVS